MREVVGSSPTATTIIPIEPSIGFHCSILAIVPCPLVGILLRPAEKKSWTSIPRACTLLVDRTPELTGPVPTHVKEHYTLIREGSLPQHL